MVISQQLDKFFDEKMKEYPTKRSFLVPMLLYTQDEIGCLTDEAIAHCWRTMWDVVGGEIRQYRPPAVGGLRPAMQQDDRRSVTRRKVLQLRAVHVRRAHRDRSGDTGVPLHGTRRWRVRRECHQQYATTETRAAEHGILLKR